MSDKIIYPFLTEFRPWAEAKEENHEQTKIY